MRKPTPCRTTLLTVAALLFVVSNPHQAGLARNMPTAEVEPVGIHRVGLGPIAQNSAPSPEPASPEPSPIEFVPATPRQEELREIVTRALAAQDEDRAMAALIALMETEAMSDIKASGMMMLMELYYNEGNHQRCIEILDAVLEQAPPLGEFEYIYGGMLVEMGRHQPAVPHLTRAIELNPDLLGSYSLLASIYSENGQEDQAATILSRYRTAVARILDLVADPSQDVMTRVNALAQFSQTPPDDQITRALGELLREDHSTLSEATIRILAQVGTPAAVPILESYAVQTRHNELSQLAILAAQVIQNRTTEP